MIIVVVAIHCLLSLLLKDCLPFYSRYSYSQPASSTKYVVQYYAQYVKAVENLDIVLDTAKLYKKWVEDEQ